MKQAPRLKKPAEVRADFDRKGISIAEWARQHHVNRTLVYEILAGNERRKCHRGQGHRVAVLLGLKHGDLTQDPASINAMKAAT